MAFRTNKTPVLQTKSASGSVATFNTALAMPLSSCNIAVNAWQEGTGDPSPVNNRPIHGFSEVNATRVGKNLFDVNMFNRGGVTVIDGVASGTGAAFNSLNQLPFSIPSGCVFSFKARNTGTVTAETTGLIVRLIYEDDTRVQQAILNSTTSFTFFSILTTKKVKAIFVTYGQAGTNTWELKDVQAEVGSTATPYEPYTGNKYTIQLGQEVYGAEVDVVNGVAHCTHSIADMGDLSWAYRADNLCFYSSVVGMKDYVNDSDYADTMNEMFKFGGVRGLSGTLANLNYYVRGSANSHMILVRYDDYTTNSAFTNAVTGKKLMFELAEPFDIQLTPTQIETLIGNNTIFADTGDVDFTYKDLDIAKRGNFREVFKLPS